MAGSKLGRRAAQDATELGNRLGWPAGHAGQHDASQLTRLVLDTHEPHTVRDD